MLVENVQGQRFPTGFSKLSMELSNPAHEHNVKQSHIHLKSKINKEENNQLLCL